MSRILLCNKTSIRNQMNDIFRSIRNPKDESACEDILADNELREDFCQHLCRFGKALSLVMSSEKAYTAFPAEEIQLEIHYPSKAERSCLRTLRDENCGPV